MTFVGIDVSKDWLDVHVAPAGEDWRVRRDATGLDELVARGTLTRETRKKLSSFRPIRIAGRPLSETIIEDREDRF